MNKHKESDSAVAEKTDRAEAHRLEAHQKELKRQEDERNKRPSTPIFRFAADLLEQASKRPRDIVENEVAMAVNNEPQGALIRAIIAHIDGNVPEATVPKDRVYSEAHKRAAEEMEAATALDKENGKADRDK